MGQGTLRIEVATLRKLLPLWLQSGGYVVDDSEVEDRGLILVDCSNLGYGADVVGGFLGSMMRQMRIEGGWMRWRYIVRIRVMEIEIGYGEEK